MTPTPLTFDAVAAWLDAMPDASTLGDHALLSRVLEVERLRRRADALAVDAAAEVAHRSPQALDADGPSARHGHRRPVHLIEELTRTSQREASARIRLGSALRPRRTATGEWLPPLWPEVASTFRSGGIGRDAAAAIVRELDAAAPRCAPGDLAAAERMLVDRATTEPADVVADHARLVRDLLDEDGIEPRDAALRSQRSFRLGRERHSMTPFTGLADPASAAMLRAALDAARPRPRFERSPRADLAVAPALVPEREPEPQPQPQPDERTFAQREFDTLMDLVTAGSRAGDAPTRARAAVVATISLGDLERRRGAGVIDGVVEPVAASTFDTLACDGGVQLLTTDDEGIPLRLGPRIRCFTPAQRRALAVRDLGCVFPLCTARAAACDAHHVVPWSEGGPTDLDNGVLLCPAHHHHLHATGRRLRMIDGRPHLAVHDRWRPLRPPPQRILRT